MARQGECIYQRKDGRWEARYLKEIDGDGRKKYGSVYAGSYDAALQKRMIVCARYTPAPAAVPTVTIGVLTQEWLAYERRRVKPATWQKYEGLSKNHILPAFGSMAAAQVTRADVERFAENQLRSGRIGGGALTEKTVNDILVILGLIFAFASEEYHISMPRISYLREEHKTARVLTREEERLLLEALITDMDIYKFGIMLALYTGIRIGELCALMWEEVTADSVVVTKTLQRLKAAGGRTELVIGEPKSPSSCRVIPLPDFLQPYIARFRRPDGFVLQSEKGGCTEPRILQIKFRKIVEQCGLSRVNFHALRHTFATRCVESDFDIKTLSEILGHADVKITLNRYVHSSFALKKSNMEKLSLPIS